MQMTNNTILITGGGSGIGRALAEKFHQLGNKVIVTGRDITRLQNVATAHAGINAMRLDITDLDAVTEFAAKLVAEYPDINVVINNAGIMVPEAMTDAPANLSGAEVMVLTNLLGPVRLTSALLPHLMKQADATVLTVSSGLAFVPLAITPTYGATKAAIHSWSVSLREQLKNTSVRVVELAPPYVQTELMGPDQANDPHAMPLAEFIDEVIAILTANPDIDEVIVDRCKALRNAEREGNFATIFGGLNAAFA